MKKKKIPSEYLKFRDCMMRYLNRDNKIPYHTARNVLAWYGVCWNNHPRILDDMIKLEILIWENKKFLTIKNAKKKNIFA